MLCGPVGCLINQSLFHTQKRAKYSITCKNARNLEFWFNRKRSLTETMHFVSYTERKSGAKNGSTPGAISWYVTQLHPWHYFLNMIIKEKNGSTLQGGTVFQNGSRVEPFWLHFFLSVVIRGENVQIIPW